MIQNDTPQKLKHVAICEELRRRIASGAYAPGDRLPSFTDLQSEFDASEVTIDRAYSALEREGKVVRKHRIGTFVAQPEAIPGRRTKQRHGTLGALIPQQLQNDSYYTRILNGLQSAGRAADVDIVLLNESSKPRWEKVDGVVTLGPTPGFPTPPPGMPIVSLLHELRDTIRVFNDDEGGARLLVEHLLQLGHRKIGYLHSARLSSEDWEYGSNNIVEARITGHRETLRASGIDVQDEWLRPLLTVEDRTIFRDRGYVDHRTLGREAMNKWLRQGWSETGCTALLATNDLVAIGIVESLQEAGLRVPGDVSVVGFDGHEAGDYFRPRLTTVVVPLEDIAARGAELLLEQVHAPLGSLQSLKNCTQTQPVVFSGTLKVGASSSRKTY